jgi:hypothetical protein
MAFRPHVPLSFVPGGEFTGTVQETEEYQRGVV